MNELFILPKNVLNALDIDEIKATVDALKQAGLYALPYPTVDVRIAGDCAMRPPQKPSDQHKEPIAKGIVKHNGEFFHFSIGDLFWADFKNISLDHINYQKFSVVEKGHHVLNPSHIEMKDITAEERDNIANVLIVLLATRNAVKERKENKLAKHGVGKGIKRYRYVTTIRPPHEGMEDDTEHKPTGRTVTPHLRRGHHRAQHYGPGNQYTKKILIPPVFVNADPTWKSTRKAYNVSISMEPTS